MKYDEMLERRSIRVPEVLIPRDRANLSRWAVIACDQYTQDRAYWKRAAEVVGTAPSALNVILPEVYLEDGDRAARLAAIRATMRDYLAAGVFSDPTKGFVYIERTTAYGRLRKGLVVAVDLDGYDWKPDAKAPIRATEATIVDRIPPRMEIRRGAPIESPHIMLLANDPGKKLVEGIGARVTSGTPLYETDLMLNAGSITGWAVDSAEDLDYAAQAIESLAQAGTGDDGSTFLFAVGDGNHSLATAKAVWDELKASSRDGKASDGASIQNHPARYALVEIVNLYDEGLTFEPIHRVLFGTSAAELSKFLAEKLGGTLKAAQSPESLERAVSEPNETRFGFVSREGISYLDSPASTLAVSRLQPALDDFIARHPGVKIDYIHGSDEVFRLAAGENAVAMLLPPVEKNRFFATIAEGGPLPRKSFSMGEASEKRFYLECRKLTE